jgi:hypothetical protein
LIKTCLAADANANDQVVCTALNTGYITTTQTDNSYVTTSADGATTIISCTLDDGNTPITCTNTDSSYTITSADGTTVDTCSAPDA